MKEDLARKVARALATQRKEGGLSDDASGLPLNQLLAAGALLDPSELGRYVTASGGKLDVMLLAKELSERSRLSGDALTALEQALLSSDAEEVTRLLGAEAAGKLNGRSIRSLLEGRRVKDAALVSLMQDKRRGKPIAQEYRKRASRVKNISTGIAALALLVGGFLGGKEYLGRVESMSQAEENAAREVFDAQYPLQAPADSTFIESLPGYAVPYEEVPFRMLGMDIEAEMPYLDAEDFSQLMEVADLFPGTTRGFDARSKAVLTAQMTQEFMPETVEALFENYVLEYADSDELTTDTIVDLANRHYTLFDDPQQTFDWLLALASRAEGTHAAGELTYIAGLLASGERAPLSMYLRDSEDLQMLDARLVDGAEGLGNSKELFLSSAQGDALRVSRGLYHAAMLTGDDERATLLRASLYHAGATVDSPIYSEEDFTYAPWLPSVHLQLGRVYKAHAEWDDAEFEYGIVINAYETSSQADDARREQVDPEAERERALGLTGEEREAEFQEFYRTLREEMP